MLSNMQFSVKVVDNDNIVRVFPEMQGMSLPYARCSFRGSRREACWATARPVDAARRPAISPNLRLLPVTPAIAARV